MFLELTESKKTSVKNCVIRILSEKWPLSSNEIYNTAERKYCLQASYQAVHKMLNRLAEEGVVVKKGKEYSLSIGWAENMEKFSKDLKTKLISHTPIYLDGLDEFKEETGMQTFLFDSFGAAEEYRKKLQKEYIQAPCPKQPYIGQSRHLKSPIVYSEKSLSILDLIRETQTECYLLVANKTKVDDWCAAYYQNEFVRVRTGCDVAKNCETMVMGDVITQMYVPEQVQECLDRNYNQAEKISDINIPKFNREVYERKAKTKFVVYKNKEIAEQIRIQTMNYFKKKVSLFDIDGTLIDGFTPILFTKYLLKKGLFEQKALEEMETSFEAYRDKRKSYNPFVKEIISLFAGGIKGQNEETIRNEADGFVDSGALVFFDYSTDLIATLKQEGAIVAVTGTPFEVAAALKKKLPFDEMFATKLEIVNGKYTGKIVENMALGETKNDALAGYFEKENAKCIFGFGDTLSDLPLLEKAKTAIALNPNKELLASAKKRGWKILTEKDDVLQEIRKQVGAI